MGTFGDKLAVRRKELALSQADLANSAGLSQTRISRLEQAQDPPSDLRVLARIAKALDQSIRDLVPDDWGGELVASSLGETFFAVCPNALCRRNGQELSEELQPVIYWRSWKEYASDEFDEINYCEECGTEFVKDCPNCGRRFRRKQIHFCVTCGKRVLDQPTDEQFDEVRQRFHPRGAQPIAEDDIPF